MNYKIVIQLRNEQNKVMDEFETQISQHRYLTGFDTELSPYNYAVEYYKRLKKVFKGKGVKQ